MSADNRQAAQIARELKLAKAGIDRAEAERSKAEQRRDHLLRESDGLISRIAAAKAAGISPGRVQQIISAPWSHRVRFVGVLDEAACAALRTRGMRLRSSGGPVRVGPDPKPPPPTKHTVYLVAKDDAEALAIVENALRRRGSFAAFTAEPVSPSATN